MNLDLLHDVSLHRNRLLRAAGQILTTAPSDPVLGEFLFANTGAAAGPLHWLVYDGVSGQGSPGTTWSILGGVNRNETATGLWTWNPVVRGSGSGDGDKAPFALGANSAFDAVGINRNRVANLNADYVDGRGVLEYADSQPSAGYIPAYGGSGQIVVADPVGEFDAVNKRTFTSGITGLIVLAPVRVATTVRLAGTRSGNVITASANAALVVDGVTMSVNDRLLLKDQQTGGSGVDNGPFVVTATGSAGAPWVVTRSSDADATGELTVGSLVYVEQGTSNRATQWSCQRPAGTTGGTVIEINVDVQLWQKSFQQSAYTAGRGLVLNGLEFNFAQNADYSVGSLFIATAARVVSPLVIPTASRFLGHTGSPGTLPAWDTLSVSDISDFPNVVIAGPINTIGRHTRWTSGTRTIEDALLEDSAGTAVLGVGNSLAAAAVGLGSESSPYKDVWTNLLRLKKNLPGGGAESLEYLLGTQNAGVDANLNHKSVVGWTSGQVKSWLNIGSTDVGAVPVDRTLTFFGTAGEVDVTPQNTWDLSADRTWTIGIDLATLDTHWCTLHTDQSLSGTKSWYSVTSSASEALIRVGVGQATEPTWSITAGGAVRWGDGLAPAAATIDFSGDRLRFDGKAVQFAGAAVIRVTSAITTTGAPTAILGLTIDDDVRRVSAADIAAFVGQPTLAVGAVGYGDSGNRLTGVAADLSYDASNKRLGINIAAPAESLDIVGSAKLTNTVTNKTNPGLKSTVTDTSTSTADWTNRTMVGLESAAIKSGTATYVTSANLDGIRNQTTITAGSVSVLCGLRSLVTIGHASSGPGVGFAYNFLSAPSATGGGALGAIGKFVHFYAQDVSGSFPAPTELYGLQVPQLVSASGTTTTAGIRLDLTTAGSGIRYNIYAPGNANNYLAGNLGLGVTVPVSRLEFAVGSTTLAPARFASTSSTSTLLTTPIAGALESRGDRLTFTDTTPTRRLLAHLDDLNFTNDGSASRAGAVVFGPADYVRAALGSEIIGSDPYTIWVRFLVPTAMRGPSADAVISLHQIGDGVTDGYLNAIRFQIMSTSLSVIISTSDANQRRINVTDPVIARFGGNVVDCVVVRSTGDVAPIVYLNGRAYAVTESGLGTQPPWTMSINSQRASLGNSYAAYGSVARIYRAAVFNRALSASEVVNLTRLDIDDSDQWGSMAAVYTSNFTASVDGWLAGGAPDNTIAFNQTVDGSSGWLSNTRINTDGRCELQRLIPASRWNARLRLTGTAFHATTQPAYLGISAGGSIVGAPPGIALPVGVSTSFSLDSPIRISAAATTRLDPMLSATPAFNVTMPVGTSWAIKNVSGYQIGCLADWQLGVGCGSVIPDRSGRYHGTVSGTTWAHFVSTCPMEVPSGVGTVARGLRRFTQTFNAKDGDTVTITHGLGTTNLTVGIWNATGQSVQAAVQRKVGSETTAIEIGFALVGAPVTPVNFLVVIIG